MPPSSKTRYLPMGKAARKRPNALVSSFHGELFRRAPELQRVLPADSETYLDAVSPQLMHIVLNLKDVEILDTSLQGVVQTYARFGLGREQLEVLGDALFDVLSKFCGPQWSAMLGKTTSMIYDHHLEDIAPADPHPRQSRRHQRTRRPSRDPGRESMARPTITLPLILDRSREGMLIDRSLVQILHALKVASWTGRLVLSVDQRQQHIDMLNGLPGTCQEDVKASRSLFMSAFAWKDGTYRLDSNTIPAPSAFTGYGDPDKVLLEGVLKHMSINDLGQRLNPWIKYFPARTEALDARLEELGEPMPLSKLCSLCNGTRSLEELLQTTWTDVRAALGSAYFAMETHLLVFQPVATSATLKVHYTNARNPGSRDSPRGSGERRRKHLPRQAPRKNPVMSDSEAYEMMGLEPGCGHQALNAAFIQQGTTSLTGMLGVAAKGDKALTGTHIDRLSQAYKRLQQLERHTPEASPKVRPRRATRNEPRVKTAPPRPQPPKPKAQSPKPAPRDTGANVQRPPRPPQSRTAPRRPDPRRHQGANANQYNTPNPWDSNLPLGDGTPEVTAHDHFRYAQRMLEQGRAEKALLSFERASRMEPDNAEFQAQVVWARYLCETSKMKSIDASLEDLLKDPKGSEARKSPREMSQVHLIRGRIAKSRGEELEALKHFRRALECDPNCIEAKREERLHHMRQNKEGNQSWLERLFKK